MDKATLIAMLRKFVNQRPGLEFGNYGDAAAYHAEMRDITKDRAQALEMLRHIELRDSITAEMIVEGAKHAYSGRLSITQRDNGKLVLDYCTGQYWPTEYRRAVCAVLASVIWDYWRDHCMPEPTEHVEDGYPVQRYRGISAGDFLRKLARDEFGRAIASRWFR
jgi:hypothetical protein